MKSPGFKHWKYHPPTQKKEGGRKINFYCTADGGILCSGSEVASESWESSVAKRRDSTKTRLQSTLTFVSNSLLILKFSVPGPALMAVTTESHVSWKVTNHVKQIILQSRPNERGSSDTVSLAYKTAGKSVLRHHSRARVLAKVFCSKILFTQTHFLFPH